jgi:hypothetical protein
LPSAVGITGKVFYIKKISATNTMFIKSVSNQTLDGVNIDSTPLAINTQYESVTLVSDGANYWII